MQSIAFILNILTIIFCILLIYLIYCFIDLQILKSKVKKDEVNEIDGLRFNILKLILKISGKLNLEKKKKFIRAANKVCIKSIPVMLICIAGMIITIALFNVLQTLDNSIVSIAGAITSVMDKAEEEETPKKDSDYGDNPWVSNKDEWIYEELANNHNKYPGYVYNTTGFRSGAAQGPYAIQLNDGSYYWYHQSKSCLSCINCGDWSSMTWGASRQNKVLFAEDGCAIYAMAIAISNLKGEAITPKDILSSLNSTIDETNNECIISNEYFDDNRNLYWDKLPEKVGGSFNVNVETVESTIESIDAMLGKGGYIWVWVDGEKNTGWPWTTSEGHFIIIRKQDGENYYCFDSADSASTGFSRMNTPVKKEQLIKAIKPDRRVVGLWVDRTFVSTRIWYGDALNIGKYTECRTLGNAEWGINLYNGLPWDYEAGMYTADTDAMLCDFVDYVNTISTESLNVDMDYLLKTCSRMQNTSAGLKSGTQTPWVQGSNWRYTIKWIYDANGNIAKNENGNYMFENKSLTSICTIDEINCVGVCVPPVVADPTFNDRFKDGIWQDKENPPNSVYGYSTQKLACILQEKGGARNIYYLPCSYIDAKGHTFIGAVTQTNIKLKGSNKDSVGNVISYNVNVALDWNGIKNNKDYTWYPSQIATMFNSPIISLKNACPVKLIDNAAEFWNIPQDVWAELKSNYRVIGFVVWPQ